MTEIEKLQNTNAELVNRLNETREKFIGYINENLKTYMPNWTVTSLNNQTLRIGFPIGYWPKSNNVQYEELEIWHGYNEKLEYVDGKYQTKREFQFTTNISAMGTFNIINVETQPDDPKDVTNEYRIYTYYAGLGILLNNTDFKYILRTLLYDYACAIDADYTELCDNNSKIRSIEREIEQAKREAEENALYESQKAEIEKADKDTYVVICKSKPGKFIYRNKPVSVVVLPSSEYNARCEMYKLNYKYCALQVISVTKLKFAA